MQARAAEAREAEAAAAAHRVRLALHACAFEKIKLLAVPFQLACRTWAVLHANSKDLIEFLSVPKYSELSVVV